MGPAARTRWAELKLAYDALVDVGDERWMALLTANLHVLARGLVGEWVDPPIPIAPPVDLSSRSVLPRLLSELGAGHALPSAIARQPSASTSSRSSLSARDPSLVEAQAEAAKDMAADIAAVENVMAEDDSADFAAAPLRARSDSLLLYGITDGADSNAHRSALVGIDSESIAPVDDCPIGASAPASATDSRVPHISSATPLPPVSDAAAMPIGADGTVISAPSSSDGSACPITDAVDPPLISSQLAHCLDIGADQPVCDSLAKSLRRCLPVRACIPSPSVPIPSHPTPSASPHAYLIRVMNASHKNANKSTLNPT